MRDCFQSELFRLPTAFSEQGVSEGAWGWGGGRVLTFLHTFFPRPFVPFSADIRHGLGDRLVRDLERSYASKLGAPGGAGEPSIYAPLFGNYLVLAPGSNLSCAAIHFSQIEPEYILKIPGYLFLSSLLFATRGFLLLLRGVGGSGILSSSGPVVFRPFRVGDSERSGVFFAVTHSCFFCVTGASIRQIYATAR